MLQIGMDAPGRPGWKGWAAYGERSRRRKEAKKTAQPHSHSESIAFAGCLACLKSNLTPRANHSLFFFALHPFATCVNVKSFATCLPLPQHSLTPKQAIFLSSHPTTGSLSSLPFPPILVARFACFRFALRHQLPRRCRPKVAHKDYGQQFGANMQSEYQLRERTKNKKKKPPQDKSIHKLLVQKKSKHKHKATTKIEVRFPIWCPSGGRNWCNGGAERAHTGRCFFDTFSKVLKPTTARLFPAGSIPGSNWERWAVDHEGSHIFHHPITTFDVVLNFFLFDASFLGSLPTHSIIPSVVCSFMCARIDPQVSGRKPNRTDYDLLLRCSCRMQLRDDRVRQRGRERCKCVQLQRAIAIAEMARSLF